MHFVRAVDEFYDTDFRRRACVAHVRCPAVFQKYCFGCKLWTLSIRVAAFWSRFNVFTEEAEENKQPRCREL